MKYRDQVFCGALVAIASYAVFELPARSPICSSPSSPETSGKAGAGHGLTRASNSNAPRFARSLPPEGGSHIDRTSWLPALAGRLRPAFDFRLKAEATVDSSGDVLAIPRRFWHSWQSMDPNLTTAPHSDPTLLYRYRDALYAADLFIVGLHLDFFSWLGTHPST